MNTLLTEQEATDIQNIIMDQLGVRRDQLTPEARLIEDLGADSLDVVEIVMKTEERFDINIPDEAAEKICSIADVFEALEERLGRKK